MQRAPLTLICLPHAGARASVYRSWSQALPWLRVTAIDYPGHGARHREPLEATIDGLVASVRREVPAEGPLAIFGHSMGALIAYELCHRLELEGRRPELLIASGSAAPSRRMAARFAALASDVAIIEELRRLGGTPEEALADRELMELALPPLRADYRACARYRWAPRAPLRTPLCVLGGVDDVLEPEGLAAWREHTRARCSLHMFAGGHFFLHQNPECLQRIAAALRRSTPAVATSWA